MSDEIRGMDAVQALLSEIVKHLRMLRQDTAHCASHDDAMSNEIAILMARVNDVSAELNVLLEEVKLARQQRMRQSQTVLVQPEKDPLLVQALEAFRNSQGFAAVIKWLVAIALCLLALIEGAKRIGVLL